jgi:TolB-like protein
VDKKRKLLGLVVCIFLMACTETVVNYSHVFPVNLSAKIAVIPLVNNTETPLVGERAMAIAAAIIESRGICHVSTYRDRNQSKALFPGMSKANSQLALFRWAQSKHARYVLTGSVNEWNYKAGLDGEPVVGISLQLIELSSGRIVWTAVGSKSGGSRVAASTVAQKLLNVMLNGLVNAGPVYVSK